MSVFISSMRLGRLQREAARVEGDRLADEPEDDLAACRGRRLVGKRDQARGVLASLADRGERAHARLANLVGAEGGEAHVLEAARGLLGELGEGGRGADVRRRVDEVAAAVRPRGDDVGALRLLGDLRSRRGRRGRGARSRDVRRPSSSSCRRRRGRAPCRRRRPAPARPRGAPFSLRIQAIGLAADLSRAPGDRGGRRAQAVGVRRPRPTPPTATRWALSCISRVQEGDSAALALELPVLDQVLDPPVDQAVELLAGRRQLDGLRDGEGQDVRVDLRRRCFDDVDLHGRARMLSEAGSYRVPRMRDIDAIPQVDERDAQ